MLINVVIGGRLGDFFQMLYVLKQKYALNGDIFNVYLTEYVDLHECDVFIKDLNQTYKELYPIMIQQPYINTFNIFNFQIEKYINLNVWRRYMDKNLWPWTNILNTVFLNNIENLEYGRWVQFDKKNDLFKNKVVIHRGLYRNTNLINWKFLVENNDCVFVGSDYKQYSEFKYRYNVPFQQFNTLSDLLSILNSCLFFVGNQTGPLAIANALNTPRLGELWDVVAVHYINEHFYTPEFNWISENDNYFGTINKYINYESSSR